MTKTIEKTNLKNKSTIDSTPFDEFKNLYSTSKTVQFELIPAGATKQHFPLDDASIKNEKNPLVREDKERHASYIRVKEVMNAYHNWFISDCLADLQLDAAVVQAYYDLFCKTSLTEADKKQLEAHQKTLRKQVVAAFKSNDSRKDILGKLFSEKVFSLLHQADPLTLNLDPATWEDDQTHIATFNKFSVYFKGFFDNRENMYKDTADTTAIAHRIVHDNLPLLFKNINQFQAIMTHDSAIIADFESANGEWGRIIERLAQRRIALPAACSHDVFSLDYVNNTFSQAGIDAYNTLLGGYKDDSQDTSIQGLNQKVNQSTALKKIKAGKMLPLKKQILGRSISSSKRPIAFLSDAEVYDAIHALHTTIQPHITNLNTVLDALFAKEYNPAGLFLKKGEDLTQLSTQWLGHWEAIETQYKTVKKTALKKVSDSGLKKIDTSWNAMKRVSITELDEWTQQNDAQTVPVLNALDEFFKREESLEKINTTYHDFDAQTKNGPLRENQPLIDSIKDYLDAVLFLICRVRLLKGNGLESGCDMAFYGDFLPIIDALDRAFYDVYGKTRNYVTQKLYSIKKIKMNFQCPSLLDGWDENKETDNFGTLLLKDGQYYLAIRHKNHKKAIDALPECPTGETYQKMVYRYLPGPNKMLPKVIFSKKNIDTFAPSDEIMEIYKNGSFKKGEGFNLTDCHTLIDFFKACILKHERWQTFGFTFSATQTYADISQFYSEVEKQGYLVSYKPLAAKQIDQLVNDGKLYLFKLHCKDFSEKSTGTPNLHTLYWESLFDPRNAKYPNMKLNGEAELFFREKSIHHDRIEHKAEEYFDRKSEPEGNKKSWYPYDILKDKRFRTNKCFLHMNLTTNFQASNVSTRVINEKAKDHITATDVTVLGIDRGENHLLYYSLINTKGEIIKQGSLNTINGTNYLDKLIEKEKSRQESRKTWKGINAIKDLKKGYLSCAIHEITQLMVAHNAMVVLEDLNFEFKKGRQKIERQVYQNFERMLIEKLNFYVRKQAKCRDVAPVYNALQLTPAFESFKKLGKQSGMLFYVPAQYTSKIDPTTGFAPVHTFRANSSNSNELLKGIQAIRHTGDGFVVTIDFYELSLRFPYTIDICIQRGVERHAYNVKEKTIITRVAYDDMAALLNSKNIGFEHGNNLVPELKSQSTRVFFERLFDILNHVMQLRYGYTDDAGQKQDYILSPVRNKQDEFFDSREVSNTASLNVDTWDGDANGAYHIALKGLCYIEQLRQDGAKAKLAINQETWFAFMQERANQG
ncbi:MAG: type V CRISPR-associated protein Cas12a/Cpf1 [Candidatus Marinamargulisbacteria bacterium]